MEEEIKKITYRSAVEILERTLREGLTTLKFEQNIDVTDLTQEHQKLVRLSYNDDDKLFINVTLGDDKFEKALSKVFVKGFRDVLCEYDRCYNKPEPSLDHYINEHYSTFTSITLDGGLICLYKIDPIDAIAFNYDIDDAVAGKYNAHKSARGKKYADRQLLKNMEKKLLKDVKGDGLEEELESIVVQVAFIVSKS